MKTMKWLLRREFWEHKGSMFWAPLVVALIMFATMSATIVYGVAAKGIRMDFNGYRVHGPVGFYSLPAELRAQIVDVATSGYLLSSAPLFLLLAFVVFWYCLGALYDERRDRSILFWKSLPASDQMTVLSKVVVAACVTPLITIAIAVAVSLALLVVTGITFAVAGINLLGPMLANPNLYLGPLALLSLLPVYVVWALPTVGWLLLVSSWARSKVFLWAAGAPLIALVITKWLNYLASNFMSSNSDLTFVMRELVARALGGVIPGIWFVFTETDPSAFHAYGKPGVDPGSIVSASWATLGTLDAWIGVVLGAAMIYGAMRIRRWRDEG